MKFYDQVRTVTGHTRLVGFDLEATGTDPWEDRIVEIAMYRGDGSQYLSTLVNPGTPIPPDSTAVHGITDDDVQDAPPFAEIAPEVCAILSVEGTALVGYNNRRYDTVLLDQELVRAGQSGILYMPEIDLLQLWHRFEPRTLASALRRFAGMEHEDAHSAEADARALPAALVGMANQLSIPLRIDELVRLSVPDGAVDRDGKFLLREDGVVVLNVGKHKGMPAENERGFLEWMIDKDFSPETKDIARRLISGEPIMIPCRWCNQPTSMLGTRECDRCHELRSHIENNPGLARSIATAVAP